MSEYGYALERLCKIMDNIEKDLHSIDISLGAMKSENINDRRQNYWNCPVPDTQVISEASEISKYQQQMIQQVISDMHAYMNKEENDENRS